MADVAFLVYSGPYKRERRKDRSFDGWDNVGAYVVKDALERAGVEVGWCTPETAHLFRVVLVSLTSPFDVFNLIASCGRYTTWQKLTRRFTVVAGGAGLMNVYPLQGLVDVAVFGRAEGFVAGLVEALLAGRDFYHESVMYLREEVAPVVYAQVSQPYPHPVKVGTFVFVEQVVGCPLKCNFCHYTYSRKWIGGDASNYVRDGQYKGSAEGLFVHSADLLEENPQSRIVTGLDGLSERLRYAFQKRISNDKVVEVLEQAGDTEGNGLMYKLYMVVSYPTETEADLQEFYDTIGRVRGGRRHLRVKVHATPFYPSPLTPGAWLPVTLDESVQQRAGKSIHRTGSIHAWWSASVESSATHVLGMLALRATESDAALVEMVSLQRAFHYASTERRLERLFACDLHNVLRAYSFDERLPTWYLHSYYSAETMQRAAQRLHNVLGIGHSESCVSLRID